MKKTIVVLALTSLALAAHATGFETGDERQEIKQQAEIAKLSKRVGKTFWVRPVKYQLVGFILSGDSCYGEKSNVTEVKKFTVVEADKRRCGNGRYRVQFEDGTDAWVDAVYFDIASDEITSSNPKDASVRAMRISKPQKKTGVSIGMTKDKVLASSWGRPRDINRTHNAHGTTEQWIYGSGNYLYFRNGILESVQN